MLECVRVVWTALEEVASENELRGGTVRVNFAGSCEDEVMWRRVGCVRECPSSTVRLRVHGSGWG